MLVEAKRLRATGMKLTAAEVDAVEWTVGRLHFEGGVAILYAGPDPRNGHLFQTLAPAQVRRVDGRGIVIVGTETVILGGVVTFPQAWWCRPVDPPN